MVDEGNTRHLVGVHAVSRCLPVELDAIVTASFDNTALIFKLNTGRRLPCSQRHTVEV